MSSKVVAGNAEPLLTEKDWHSLIDLINQTYISFNKFISSNDYGLTSTETRYCYLAFLELDIRSESILLNINSESVSKRRLRVRQKLGCIGSNMSLYQYFVNI